jgi:hypothetical protein
MYVRVCVFYVYSYVGRFFVVFVTNAISCDTHHLLIHPTRARRKIRSICERSELFNSPPSSHPRSACQVGYRYVRTVGTRYRRVLCLINLTPNRHPIHRKLSSIAILDCSSGSYFQILSLRRQQLLQSTLPSLPSLFHRGQRGM